MSHISRGEVGAAGEIATESTNKHALRKGPAARSQGGTRLLQGFDIDESSSKPVAEQARAPHRARSRRRARTARVHAYAYAC